MMVSDYNPLVIVNQKIREIDDSYQLSVKRINELLNSLILQTQEQAEIRKTHCEICLIRNVKFQGHHIGGQYNDYRQITTCLSCHHILTEKQKLDSRIWTKENPELLKQSFFLRGLYDVLNLMAEKRHESLYAQIANSLTNTIYSLQRSAQN